MLKRFVVYLTLTIGLLTSYSSSSFFLVCMAGCVALGLSLLYYISPITKNNNSLLYHIINNKTTQNALGGIFLGITCGLLSILIYRAQHPPMSGEPRSEVFQGRFISGRKGNVYVFSTTNGNSILVRDLVKEVPLGEDLLLSGFYVPTNRLFTSGGLFDQYPTPPAILTGGFDYDMWKWISGYDGDIYAQTLTVLNSSDKDDEYVPESKELFLSTHIYHTYLVTSRQRLRNRIASVYTTRTSQALLAGMLVGDISRMTTQEYDIYVLSNLVHLVAVSGGNLVMLVIFLTVALFWLPFRVRYFCVACILVIYALLVGLDSSVTRALIMGILTLLALVTGRSPHIGRLMMLAWIVLLLRRPYALLYDLGFLLSFSALGGIVMVQYWLGPLVRSFTSSSVSSFLREYVLANAGASLGVLPVLILRVGEMNMLGVLSNMVVLPLVPLIMVGGGISLFFPQRGLSSLVDPMLGYVYTVARFSAENPVLLGGDDMLTRVLYVVLLTIVYACITYCLHVYRKPRPPETK